MNAHHSIVVSWLIGSCVPFLRSASASCLFLLRDRNCVVMLIFGGGGGVHSYVFYSGISQELN